MGCYGSRSSLSMSIELRYLIPFEKSLGFQSCLAKDCNDIFYKYSSNEFLTFSQLTKALSELGIYYKPFIEFFLGFNKSSSETLPNRRYNTRKLICLGTLFGKGNKSDKIILLFTQYEIKSSKLLSKYELYTMISDITLISLKIIPEFNALANRRDSNLEKYVLDINTLLDYTIQKYVNFFLQGTIEMNFDEFCKAFETRKIKRILNPSKLRRWVYKQHIKVMSNLEKFGASQDKTGIKARGKDDDGDYSNI
jgi:hypothetical protein